MRYEAKFRSGNLLENGNKNRWIWPCCDLLLSLIRTRRFGKNSLLHLSFIVKCTLLYVRIKDKNNSPHGKFHRFLFPFSSKFSDLNITSYVLCIYLYYVTCHTQWAWVTCPMEQHKPTFRSKNPRIIAWKLNLEWEHLFRTFLTWFRRKNYLGGLKTRTKEETYPLFESDGILMLSAASICRTKAMKCV